jgi:hypothetical protein
MKNTFPISMTRRIDGGGPVTVDASSDVLVVGDHAATPAPMRCPVGAPFTPPTQLDIAGFSVESARLNLDQTAGVFGLCTGTPATQCSIYTGRRNGNGFDSFVTSALPDAGGYDGYPAIASDGLLMLFASTRPADAPPRLFSTPVKNGVSNGSVTALPFPTTPAAVRAATQPYLLANGALYFVGQLASTFAHDLYRSEDASAASVEGAQHLANSTGSDQAPVVSEDELEIFWGSDVGDVGFDTSTNGLKIWTAHRASTAPAGQFEGNALVASFSPTSVSPLNHAHPVWLSPDACDLYLVVGTDNGDAGTLWVAHR